ncbi:MAG TPA: VOC family protein [Methylibium sp.]|uniref:VOC family protein n=1 Tax=Methylibium sp. TaxID=2067992 RepID=UPI002DB60B59|nr:VOC family protein [Methylibium sp.]HEU4458517.1 VOC family protein [Methylibium sp.]
MTTRRYASGALHALTPCFSLRDAEAGIAFYAAAFGAREVMRHMDGARIAHAQLRIGDALLMLSHDNPAYPEIPAAEDSASPVGFFLEVGDADATVARAVELGAALVYPLRDQDYGRSGTVRDPFGLHWHVTSQPGGGAGA